MSGNLLPVCTLSESSDRAPTWRHVFGRLDDIPIVSYRAELATLPGRTGADLVYMLDIARLAPDERGRLIEYIARRFKLPAEAVALDLDSVGCPVLAADVIVAIPRRLLV